MTFKEGATLAKRSFSHELIFTHFSPSMMNPKEFINNATEVFNNSHIAYDGMKKEINFIK